jgi:hypothetical protein
MGEKREITERQRIDNIFGEFTRLNTLRDAVGHALRAAELGRAELLQRVDSANESIQDSVGMGIALGTSEAFEFDETNQPNRILPSDFNKSFGRAGLLQGVEVFDRITLPMNDNLRLPLYDVARERLEICFVLEPDERNHSRTAVQAKTLIPSGKIEGPIVMFESPFGPYSM